jgi:glycosyltransferase involved in cell wall biosynthesis
MREYVVYGQLAETPQCRLFSNGKWETRKALDLLIRAFTQEFSAAEDNVELIILTRPFHDNTTWEEKMEPFSSSSSSSRVSLMVDVPFSLLPNLYASMNGFVLPSRGEGWGRPYSESMAMGLPVIATNWSGHTAYMDDSNSLLLKYELVERMQDGHKWAEPNGKHLRQLMRQVCSKSKEDQDKMRNIGANARRTMERFSRRALAEDQIFKRIKEIYATNIKR